MPTDLNTPILDEGLRRIPFFNGRVLTAEDLDVEKEATATRRRQLGRGLGAGVIEGLFVHPGRTDTTLTVEPGIGLTPSGMLVELPQETEVSVVSEIEEEGTAGTGGDFANCATQHAIITSGTGAYLLVAERASAHEGRVPRVGLGGDGVAGECGAQYEREGAQLRLVCLSAEDGDMLPSSIVEDIDVRSEAVEQAREAGRIPGVPDVSMLRNLWAHVCLGSASLGSRGATSLDTLRHESSGHVSHQSSVLNALCAEGELSDDVVPLGLLFWGQDEIAFVDAWAVRRRVYGVASPRDPSRVSMAPAVAEASVLQFQNHLSWLSRVLSGATLSGLSAREYFRLLPPLGMLPAGGDGSDHLPPKAFFDEIPHREPVFIEAADLGALFHEASTHPSQDISENLFWWVYQVRENLQADLGWEGSAYHVFASGSLSYYGDAQFDLARWDYSNYGVGVDVD